MLIVDAGQITAIYKQVETKWYSLLDALSDKGVPVYKLVDPIENMGIPSFPLFVGGLIVLLALVAFLLIGGAGGPALTVTVTSGGAPLAGATVIAGDYEATTNEDGIAGLDHPGEGIDIQITKENCEAQVTTLTGTEATLEFDLICREAPPVGACSTISKEYDAIVMVGEDNAPLEDCVIIALNGGDPMETGWGADGNTLFLDDATCLQEDHQIQITCLGHERTLFIDELRNEIEEKGEITLNKRGSSGASTGQGDCDRDGIPDAQDLDNDNDGIFDVEDFDIDGDGVTNALDADTCGQDTREDAYSPTDVPGLVDLPVGTQAQQTFNSYVTVVADTGEKLDGIRVTATDVKGTKLSTGYANTVVEATTANGSATLSLPEGQKYYITAEDSNDVYRSAKSGLLTQNRQQEVKLVMQKGFLTVITVVSDRAVPYATVRVLDDPQMERQTSKIGQAIFVLVKGIDYDVEVVHENYIPLKTKVVGGSETEIRLEALDASNSGDVTATVRNAQGIEEGFPSVLLELVDSKNIVVKKCTTPASGMCQFTKAMAGDYTLRATPPGEISYTESKKFTVVAGESVDHEMLIDPAEAEIDVLTTIDGNPTKGVTVTLYDLSYGVPEKLSAQKSAENRRVKFNSYRGKKVYLEAEYRGALGEFGPLTTAPFTLTGNKDMELDLKEITRSVSLELPTGGEIAPGQIHYAKLVLELPYASEELKETYDKAMAEVWFGEPGDKSNPLKSPVLIGPIDSYIFEQQEKPNVLVSVGNSYTFNQEVIVGDSGTTSKIARFTVSDYDPTLYEIELPMLARREAQGDVTVRYRATWTDDDGRVFTSHGGEWAEDTLTVLAGDDDDDADWVETTGDFGLWNAFLSADPSIEEEQGAEETGEEEDELAASFFPDGGETNVEEDGVPSFTSGSLAFLHVRAIAAQETDTYVIKVDSFPPIGSGDKHMAPLAYRGVINKAGGKSRIVYPTTLAGDLPITFSPTQQSKDYYALDVDDEIHLVVAMRPQDATPLAEVAVFNDMENTLPYRVKQVGEGFEPTDIPNVEGNIMIKTLICPSPPYIGECGEGETTVNETLPSYDADRTEGRDFTIKIELRNKDSVDKNMKMRVDATGIEGLEYEDDALLTGNSGETLSITGKGASAGGGEIKIFIWLDGMEESEWKSIKHSAVKYKLEVVATGDDGKSFQEGELNTHAAEIEVAAVRETWGEASEEITTGITTVGHADAIRLSKDSVEAWARLAQDMSGNKKFTTAPDELDLDWGMLTVQAGHPEFRWLERSYEVHGSLIDPVTSEYGFTLTDFEPFEFRYAVITNNWDEEIKVTVAKDRWESTVFGEEYGLSHELRVVDAMGTERDVEDSYRLTRNVPARGKAELWILAAPPGDGCKIAPSLNKLSVTAATTLTKSEGGVVEDEGAYEINFTCAMEGGPAPAGDMATGIVMKVGYQPADITPDSCTTSDDVTYICDAEQFSVAVLKSAKELTDGHSQAIRKVLALSDDVVNSLVIATARQENSLSKGYPVDVTSSASTARDGSLILTQDEITCGLVTILFEKLTDEKIKATIEEVNSSMPWCAGGSGSFLGILNYDKNLRKEADTDVLLQYAEFAPDTDVTEFRAAVAAITTEKYVFGHMNPTTPDVKGKAAKHVVYYDEFTADEFKQVGIRDPMYSWLTQDYDTTGYFNINDKGDVQLGIIYESADNLERNRECMVYNLLTYWSLGDSSVLDGIGNEEETFDLSTCEMEGTLAAPPGVSLRLDATTPEYKVGASSTGDPEIALYITSDIKAEACYVWNGHDENPDKSIKKFVSQEGVFEVEAGQVVWDGYTLQVPSWDLKPGADSRAYTVKAACISDVGIWSERVSKQIIYDATPPEIVIVSTEDNGVTKKEAVKISFTASDKYAIRECSIEGVCPEFLIDTDCTLPAEAPVNEMGNKVYTVTDCVTPLLKLNGDIKDTCSPSGYNQLKLTCTDEHDNTASVEKNVYRLATTQAGIVPPTCDDMETGDGTECKDYDSNTPNGFVEKGDRYYVDSDDVTISVVVSSDNPLIGCSLKQGDTEASCGLPKSGSTDYLQYYDCNTKQPGIDLLGDGETKVSVKCSQTGTEELAEVELLPFVVDTEPPTCNIIGGEYPQDWSVYLAPWKFAKIRGQSSKAYIGVMPVDDTGWSKVVCGGETFKPSDSTRSHEFTVMNTMTGSGYWASVSSSGTKQTFTATTDRLTEGQVIMKCTGDDCRTIMVSVKFTDPESGESLGSSTSIGGSGKCRNFEPMLKASEQAVTPGKEYQLKIEGDSWEYYNVPGDYYTGGKSIGSRDIEAIIYGTVPVEFDLWELYPESDGTISCTAYDFVGHSNTCTQKYTTKILDSADDCSKRYDVGSDTKDWKKTKLDAFEAYAIRYAFNSEDGLCNINGGVDCYISEFNPFTGETESGWGKILSSTKEMPPTNNRKVYAYQYKGVFFFGDEYDEERFFATGNGGRMRVRTYTDAITDLTGITPCRNEIDEEDFLSGDESNMRIYYAVPGCYTERSIANYYC
ncbi:collagen binding domain-containing protein [archaeon]